MTTDEKVELAEKIEGSLIGVTPSEWSKWSSYCISHGLKKAIKFAETLQDSPSLRAGPRQSYRSISETIRKFQKQLSELTCGDLQEVLGFVRWGLIARRGTEHREERRTRE